MTGGARANDRSRKMYALVCVNSSFAEPWRHESEMALVVEHDVDVDISPPTDGALGYGKIVRCFVNFVTHGAIATTATLHVTEALGPDDILPLALEVRLAYLRLRFVTVIASASGTGLGATGNSEEGIGKVINLGGGRSPSARMRADCADDLGVVVLDPNHCIQAADKLLKGGRSKPCDDGPNDANDSHYADALTSSGPLRLPHPATIGQGWGLSWRS